MENKISVIVTIHNAESYLEQCLDSLINQTFKNIEILCMDGGSVDKSPEILKRYANKDSRIKIINDPITSYGHKVNAGIDLATSDYIAVLESDDAYEPFMLEKLYEIATKYNTDYVNANYTNFYNIGQRVFSHEERMYEDEDYNKLFEFGDSFGHLGNIKRYWTGLFSKKFLIDNNIRMNESAGASYQDMSFRFLTSVLAKRVYHLDSQVYLYRIDNPNSSMHDSTKTVIIADEHDFLQSELEKRNITDFYVWHNAFDWKYSDFFGNMTYLNLRGANRQKLFDRYLVELEKDREILKTYRGESYSEITEYMITKSPEEVMKKIEDDCDFNELQKEKHKTFMDKCISATEKEVVFFGFGRIAQSFYKNIKHIGFDIDGITDNSEALWGTSVDNIEILSPADTIKKFPNANYVIINKYYSDDIKNQLIEFGIKEENILQVR